MYSTCKKISHTNVSSLVQDNLDKLKVVFMSFGKGSDWEFDEEIETI